MTDEVREKVDCLPQDQRVPIRTALVYEGKLDPRLENEGYFDFLVPFGRLLEGT